MMSRLFNFFCAACLSSTLSACQAPVYLASPPVPGPALQSFSQPSPQGLKARYSDGLRRGVIQLRRIRFDKWDLNPTDGVLTRQEVSDRNLALPNDLITGFHDYDVNRDGRITFEEFLREEVIEMWMDLYADIVDGEFLIRDLNNNRVLDGAELQELRELFSRWPQLNGGDLNRDGRVSYAEFEDAYMQVVPWLSSLRSQTLPQG
ncbi:MAG: EF-hand domain-containing protein [Candidatus Sericytochromatia bacterium]|nr:EF-hand domain-containing protein [Candidatus Sericytochromatia bacterium]